jgi:hypothetical protein
MSISGRGGNRRAILPRRRDVLDSHHADQRIGWEAEALLPFRRRRSEPQMQHDELRGRR